MKLKQWLFVIILAENTGQQFTSNVKLFFQLCLIKIKFILILGPRRFPIDTSDTPKVVDASPELVELPLQVNFRWNDVRNVASNGLNITSIYLVALSVRSSTSVHKESFLFLVSVTYRLCL